jgi:hypothetical protein
MINAVSCTEPILAILEIPLLRIRDSGWKKDPDPGSGMNILEHTYV